MSEDKKVSWGTIFSVSAVCFGIHVGGGFASGNQTVQFFVKYGWPAIFMPIIAMFLLNAIYFIGQVAAQVNKAGNMGELARAFYYPLEKIFSPIYQFVFIVVGLIATAASIAGSAALLVTYGVPYAVGVIVTGVLFYFLTIFGKELVAKASGVMTIGIIVSLLIICYFGLTADGADLAASTNTADTPVPWGLAIWSMLQYVGYQCMTVTTISPYAASLKTPQNVLKMVVLNFVLNTFMIVLCSVLLLAWIKSPALYVNGKLVAIPMLTPALGAGHTWIRHLYSVCLYLAFISTAVGCIFGTVTRYENSFLPNIGIRLRRGILSIAMMAIAMAMSFLGLTALVAKGYAHVGKVAVFLVIIPAFTFIAARTFKGKVTRRDLLNK